MQQHLCKCVSANCVWAVCSFNLINFAVALLPFKVILDESCNCLGFDISLRLKESKYFWAKCLDVVISERMFLCIIQTLGAFLFGIQLYTP